MRSRSLNASNAPDSGSNSAGGDERRAAEHLLLVEDRLCVLAVGELDMARRGDHPVRVEGAFQCDGVDVGREELGAEVLR